MATPVIMPKLGFTMEEGTIVHWFKQEGDRVEKGEPLVEVTTDKVNMEVESPASGILRAVNAKPDQVVPVTQVIAYIAAPGETVEGPVLTTLTGEAIRFEAPVSPITRGGEKEQISAPPQAGEVAATPVARRMAKELGIDLAAIQGTGPRGRITETDVRAAAEKTRAPAPTPAAKTIPLVGRRKIMAERMSKSAREAPHIILTLEVDMSAAEKRRGTVSYTALIAQGVAQVLKQHPLLNATLRDQEIVLNPSFNLGIAVDTPDGLIVPVVKNVDQKSLTALDSEINDLAQRARNGKLTLPDIEGGTFTISNLGMFGIEEFHAIINPPESAILAVGAIVRRPVAVGDLIGLRPMMNMTLSADHRVLDGAAAARFLQELKVALEQ